MEDATTDITDYSNYDTTTNYTTSTTDPYSTYPYAEPSPGVSLGLIVAYLAILVLMFASMWRIFTKAKQPGWAAIVPVYNYYVMLKIVNRPWWWLLIIILVPFVNLIFLIILFSDLAKAFGKGIGYTLLMIFLPFIGFPMLAWGKAQYQGLPKR